MSKSKTTTKPIQEPAGVARDAGRRFSQLVMDEQLMRLRGDLAQRDQLLEHFILEIRLKSEALTAKDGQLRDKDGDLRLKDEHINTLLDLVKGLEVKLMQKDTRVAALQSEISIVNNNIESLEGKLREKEAFILSQSNQINVMRASHGPEVQHHRNPIMMAEPEGAEKERLNHQKGRHFIYARSTLGYFAGRIPRALLGLLYALLKNTFRVTDRRLGRYLWPRGTKRRLIVDALMSLRHTIGRSRTSVRKRGVKWCLKALRRRLLRVSSVAAPPNIWVAPIDPIEIKTVAPHDSFDDLATLDAGISVIIPTLNGSNDLVKLLPSLFNQKGLKHLEVVVVDSGSTDDTVELAKAYGAKVVEIPPDQFSHSHARNIGAEHASHEYLLVMVQDALPPCDTWIHQMGSFLRRERVAAVSCMETPKVDADLFSRVENWYHYKVILELNGNDKVLSKPESSDPVTLRKHAQLSDVACLMPREILRRYKFRGEYAEDLDLGLRLINDGHRLGLLSSTRVIHSHKRDPFYYLKRGYVDKMVLAQILNEPLEETVVEFRTFIQDVFFCYQALQSLDRDVFTNSRLPMSVEEFATKVPETIQLLMEGPYPAEIELTEHEMIDKQSRLFLQTLYSNHLRDPSVPSYGGILLPGILAFHSIVYDYMGKTYETVDPDLVQDFRALTYNYYMNLIGRYLAVCYLKLPLEERKVMEAINLELDNSI